MEALDASFAELRQIEVAAATTDEETCAAVLANLVSNGGKLMHCESNANAMRMQCECNANAPYPLTYISECIHAYIDT